MSSPSRFIFYPFAEGAVLHEEGSHRLWVLNHSSAALWCFYEEHGLGDRLVAAYADHFDLSLRQARADVDNALAEFVQTGLLSELPAPSPQPPAPIFKYPVTSSQVPARKVPLCWNKTYQLAGVSWQISSTDVDVAEKWFDCFVHLETCLPSADLHYDLTEGSSGWMLTGPVETVSTLEGEEVLPWLLTMLFAELCKRQPHHLLLHAATLCRDGQLLLLPGESAFGKSTLAAALATHDWVLYSDELAPLNPDTLNVTPFPLPIGIKSRSISVLQSYYPDLSAQAACCRADGQLVRYLATSQIPLADPDANLAPVAVLIFPRYLPDAATCLTRLTPLRALERLAQTGSSERPLRSNDVEALLALAGQRPCWSLDYCNLEEAIKEVSTAWSLY
jgi:hypothetical protein